MPYIICTDYTNHDYAICQTVLNCVLCVTEYLIVNISIVMKYVICYFLYRLMLYNTSNCSYFFLTNKNIHITNYNNLSNIRLY